MGHTATENKPLVCEVRRMRNEMFLLFDEKEIALLSIPFNAPCLGAASSECMPTPCRKHELSKRGYELPTAAHEMLRKA